MGLLPCEKGLTMILIFSDKSQEEINMEIGGPFLIAALFCEKVLHEKDGVLSLIPSWIGLHILIPRIKCLHFQFKFQF